MKIAFFLNVGMSEDFYTIVEHVKFTAKKKKEGKWKQTSLNYNFIKICHHSKVVNILLSAGDMPKFICELFENLYSCNV